MRIKTQSNNMTTTRKHNEARENTIKLNTKILEKVINKIR